MKTTETFVYKGHLGYLSMQPEVLDKLILWRVYRIRDTATQEELQMQRQFTIEIRVDYADNGKNEAMRTALQAAARNIYATAVLLADGVKPQIAIFSDDFFDGHEIISLLQDTVAQGVAAIASEEPEEGVSDELLQAAIGAGQRHIIPK
jgi:hypothetical protein